MLINYNPLIRLLSQTIFLLIFTHLGSFTIEDLCNIYNNSLMEETKTLLMEETKTLLMELYPPQLENKVLDKIHSELLQEKIIEYSQGKSDEITPSDFFTEKNILIAMSTVFIIMYFFK
jgi:hypothetical protein